MTSSQLAIVDGGQAEPPVQNLWEWIQEGFNINRSATAFIVAYKEPEYLSYLLPNACKQLVRQNQKCLEWTFEQIEAAALNLATFLHEHGVKRADVLSTFVTNSLEWVVTLLASIRLGIIFAPMDLRELAHPEMLQYQMKCTGTTVVVVLNEIIANKFDVSVDKTLPVKLKIVFSRSETLQGWINLSKISNIVNSVQLPQILNQQASDICSIGFTSGTTSVPKGVAYSVDQLAYTNHPLRSVHRTRDASARWVLNTTNFRVVLRITLFDAWRCGASAVLPSPTFDPESLLRAAQEHNCTHLHTLPAQAKTMIMLPNFENLRPSSMRYVGVGGDVTNFSLIEHIKTNFRAQRVETSWGMTEAAGIAYSANTPPPFSIEDLACVGTAWPGTVVKICSGDGESGSRTLESRKPLERGEDGCLHISGPGIPKQYIHNRDPEAFYDDEDGRRWLITGDIARMDDEGRIYIIGRSKDIIKWKGLALSPAAFESVLADLPEIHQISVFGLPSYLEGSVPAAVIECREGCQRPTLETLNSALHKQRTDDYTLDAVYELSELGLENWPANSVGKIMKRDLLNAVLRQKHGG